MLEGGSPGVPPPARLPCPSTRQICDPAPRGVVERGARAGVFPPARLLCPSTRPAAVSKHETGTVTKQTTGALQFMVAFSLRGGGCYTYANISHFVVPWEAGGASPNQHPSDLEYNF